MTRFATLLAGGLYVVSPVAKADVMFGSLTPTPACGPVSGPGSVCGINETFTPASQHRAGYGQRANATETPPPTIPTAIWWKVVRDADDVAKELDQFFHVVTPLEHVESDGLI